MKWSPLSRPWIERVKVEAHGLTNPVMLPLAAARPRYRPRPVSGSQAFDQDAECCRTGNRWYSGTGSEPFPQISSVACAVRTIIPRSCPPCCDLFPPQPNYRDRCGRALPHPHHPAPQEAHRRHRSGWYQPGSQLEGWWQFSLLPFGAIPFGKRQMGQLGHQQSLQHRHAYRGGVQAGRLCLLAERYGVLAARSFHGAGFHLRHHPEPEPRPAPATLRRGWPERTLLVMCSAFRARADAFANLTVKKIPKVVLSRCEWGKDDYSLRVENLPKAPPEPGQQELEFA